MSVDQLKFLTWDGDQGVVHHVHPGTPARKQLQIQNCPSVIHSAETSPADRNQLRSWTRLCCSLLIWTTNPPELWAVSGALCRLTSDFNVFSFYCFICLLQASKHKGVVFVVFLWLFDSLLLNKTGFGLVLVFSGHSLGSGESLSKVTQKHLYTKSTCWDTLTVEDSKPGETWTMTSRIMYWH